MLRVRQDGLPTGPRAFNPLLRQCRPTLRLSLLDAFLQNIAAQQNHRDACFALTAWYLVGSPGVLPQSDTEAYLWARKAAEGGLVKAMYATGYFLEVGIGTEPNMTEYVRFPLRSTRCLPILCPSLKLIYSTRVR